MASETATPPSATGAKRGAAKNPSASEINEFAAFAIAEAEDNKILRASMWFAGVVHLVLLLINFPAIESQPMAEPPDEAIHVFVNKRWRPPPPQKELIPPKRTKRMPVPDPTPHDPEPIPLDDPNPVVDLPDFDEDFISIPDAPPPPPEPEGPIAVTGEVTKPVKVHAPMPAYTEVARRVRIEGVVIVQAIIDKQGSVTEIKVLKQLPMGLTEAAVDAIQQWKFKPATLRGKPVDVYYNLTVTFSLQ